ncbi:MAG: hypothetical protein [Arizlama microvirus]|nr:MAG: hypothetical protein [Arizlama microvirus]
MSVRTVTSSKELFWKPLILYKGDILILKKKRVWFNVLSAATTIVAGLSGHPIPAEIAAVSIGVINVIITAFNLKEGAKEATE